MFVMGARADSVGAAVERMMRSMMQASLNNSTHETFPAQTENRLLSLRCRSKSFRRSFIPAAVTAPVDLTAFCLFIVFCMVFFLGFFFYVFCMFL